MSVQASTWAIEQACATPTEKAVLLVIANYAGPDGACYPGQETIARQACCSVKSVERALAVFEERGWITRQHRQRRDGSRTSDLIHFSIAPNPEPLDQPDTVSVRREPTRHPVQSNPTPCPIQPDTVSGLTTFEPLGEPLGEVGGVERERANDDWPPGNPTSAVVAAVNSGMLDPNRSAGLITTAGRFAAWKRAGASFAEDVVPVIAALTAKQRQPISSWAFFDNAIARSIADRARDLEAAPDQPRQATGPPSNITDRIAAEHNEARRMALERLGVTTDG